MNFSSTLDQGYSNFLYSRTRSILSAVIADPSRSTLKNKILTKFTVIGPIIFKTFGSNQKAICWRIFVSIDKYFLFLTLNTIEKLQNSVIYVKKLPNGQLYRIQKYPNHFDLDNPWQKNYHDNIKLTHKRA